MKNKAVWMGALMGGLYGLFYAITIIALIGSKEKEVLGLLFSVFFVPAHTSMVPLAALMAIIELHENDLAIKIFSFVAVPLWVLIGGFVGSLFKRKTRDGKKIKNISLKIFVLMLLIITILLFSRLLSVAIIYTIIFIFSLILYFIIKKARAKNEK